MRFPSYRNLASQVFAILCFSPSPCRLVPCSPHTHTHFKVGSPPSLLDMVSPREGRARFAEGPRAVRRLRRQRRAFSFDRPSVRRSGESARPRRLDLASTAASQGQNTNSADFDTYQAGIKGWRKSLGSWVLLRSSFDAYAGLVILCRINNHSEFRLKAGIIETVSAVERLFLRMGFLSFILWK